MLKITIFVLCLVSVWALPASKEEDPVPIISQESVVDVDGKFHFSYESGDGTKAEEEGELKQLEEDEPGVAVHGSYEYTGDDGKVYHVEYTADENGFQPHGEHIPEVPEVISKAIQRNAEHPEEEEEEGKQKHKQPAKKTPKSK